MMKPILKSVLAGALLLWAQLAAAQLPPGAGVTQSGAVTSNDCAAWAGNGQVKDAGAPCGGSGGTPANPTATAGPAAVNGAATTYMRSDAAPAVQLGTNAQKGVVQVDGTTITATAGVVSAVNTGTVSSIATSCGVTGGTITTTGTIKAIATPNAQTGTSYAVLDADCGKAVTLSNAAAVAVSIAQAGTAGSFASGWFATISNQGAGLVTITPATSTINGAATLTLKQFQSVDLWTDGANYFAATGRPTSVACADLTNGGTACTAATGTSGHTLPFLDGANIFSGTQTFGNVFGTVSTQSGTTYTLASTDCGTEVVFTNPAAVTVTIPATLTTGCNIAILQTTAAGQVTVTGTAVSAATLHSGHSYTKTFGQWSIIGINIYTTGVAILTGDGA